MDPVGEVEGGNLSTKDKMASPKVCSSCEGCGPWIIGSLIPRPSDTECGEPEGLAGYEASP